MVGVALTVPRMRTLNDGPDGRRVTPSGSLNTIQKEKCEKAVFIHFLSGFYGASAWRCSPWPELV